MPRPGPERAPGELDGASLRALAGPPVERRRAFQRLYEAHRDEVFSFLVALTRDRPLAEDLLQEGFARVYAGLDRFDPGRPLRPWLFRIVRNVALDALRRRRKEKGLLDGAGEEDAAADSVEALVGLEAEERVARARRALAALPDESRALLLQRHGVGLTHADLADALACSERTVRYRLVAAAEQFAQAFLRAGPPHEGGST